MLKGAEKTASGLKLPSTVTIKKEDAEVTSVSVSWNLTRFASGSYNSTKTTEQKFVVNAKVALVAILAKSLKTYKKFLYKKGLNKKAKITK